MRFVGSGRCLDRWLRWKRKFVKIGNVEVCQSLKCFERECGMGKNCDSSFCVKVLGKPYVLALIVLIMDIIKKIGARTVGSRIPSPPDDRFSEAIDHACDGRESMSRRSCKKSCEEEVSELVKLEVKGEDGVCDLAFAESR